MKMFFVFCLIEVVLVWLKLDTKKKKTQTDLLRIKKNFRPQKCNCIEIEQMKLEYDI